MKRVLLTGATGFIGRHAIEPLVRRGFDVHAVTIPGDARATAAVQWHHADLLDEAATGRVLEAVRPTHLLHFAWYVAHGQFWTSPDNLRWLRAGTSLVEAFHAVGGRRVVMSGTCAEYDWSEGHCVEGRTPLAPATLYGAAKHALNVVVDAYAAQVGLSAAWGRIFLLYGPHEHPDRLVASVVRALLAGEPALCSAGTQVRDFLHVADVAGAFAALLDSDVTGPVNIASGEPVAVKDVILEIAAQVGREDLVRLGARTSNEPARITASVDRLFTEVGWKPSRSRAEGLSDAIEWWRRTRA